ncbi:MAG: acetyltransferase [Boseongicola sp.]
MQEIVILGAGGFAQQAVWCVSRRQDMRVVAMLDELQSQPSDYQGIPIVRDLDDLAEVHQSVSLLSAVGNPGLRKRWAQEYGRLNAFCSLIDPDALVAPNARLGEGNILLPGSICSTNSEIGNHVIIGYNASVSHDASVGSFSHLASSAILNGHARVGDGCRIGAGAIVLPNVEVGDGAIVGAGAVVHRDVAPGRTVAGIPARAVPGKRA